MAYDASLRLRYSFENIIMMKSDAKSEYMKAVRTTVSLPTEQYQQLQLLADQYGLSIAWLIRQAVNDFLSRSKSFEPMNSRPPNMED